MATIREMPYREKCANAQENVELVETFTLPFVQKALGDEAVVELQSIWGKRSKSIPKDAFDEEKYEVAYGNWISKESNAFSFVREKLGEAGFEQFIRAYVEALKRKNSGAASLLRVVRVLTRGSAFTLMAKRIAYLLQWMTPFSISELNRDRAVFTVPRCKILDYPNSEPICAEGCQRVYPMWLAEQLKAKMETNRQGNRCTLILAPL